MENNKKTGYFSVFGLRQACDLLLIIASVFLIVGMFVEPLWVTIVGFSLFIVGALISIVRMLIVARSSVKNSSPELRNAIINIVIMTVVFGLAVFGLIYNLTVFA